MLHIYNTISQISSLLWVVAFLYCLPGLGRFIFGRARYYDPLKSLVVLGAVNRTGFAALAWVTGHVTLDTDPEELLARTLLYVLSGSIAVVTVFVVRSYARERDQ